MEKKYEDCTSCGEPNFLYDIFPWCPKCYFLREERKRNMVA